MESQVNDEPTRTGKDANGRAQPGAGEARPSRNSKKKSIRRKSQACEPSGGVETEGDHNPLLDDIVYVGLNSDPSSSDECVQ